MKDLAVFTALNHSGSFGKNFVKFKKKKKCYLPAKGRSVWWKTVTSVLKCFSPYGPPSRQITYISFVSLVQKKRLEVNVSEKWNLLSIIVNIWKSRQYCRNENINDSLFIRWDKRERVLSDITKPRLPRSFWISTWVSFGHVLGNV